MINPNRIPKERMPIIVLSDHSSGFAQWIIKWRTKANYNHIMLMLYPGEFVSQGNTFSTVPVSRYMTNQSRLKFWKIKDLKLWEKNKLYSMVNSDLRGSWWSRRYDYLGILGQALGLRFINNPWTMYCPERVRKYLSEIMDLKGLSKHPSPKDFNEYMKNNDKFEVYGRWSAD